MDKITQAAQTGVWLAAKQPVHIPISNRLDHLLEEIERDSSHRPTDSPDDTTLSTKKLYIDGEEVTLSQQELDGLLVLKQFHWLLSRYNDSSTNLDTIIHSQPYSAEHASSPLDRLKDYLIDSGVISDGHSGFLTQTGIDNAGINVEDPSTLPDVHILELVLLAEQVESSIEKNNQQPPPLDTDILEQQYITSGVEGGVSDSSRTIHNELDFFDEDEGKEFAKYLAEVSSSGERDDPSSSDKHDEDVNQFESSLVNALAADTNILALKADVDASNNDIQASQIHLINYKEFIEKKRKQRIQCLRDMKLHCCKCRGPHISKPPFSHGKDYRKDPAHPQHQGNNCLFLKKKRAELKWLDETVGNYSLRLMEIAADD